MAWPFLRRGFSPLAMLTVCIAGAYYFLTQSSSAPLTWDTFTFSLSKSRSNSGNEQSGAKDSLADRRISYGSLADGICLVGSLPPEYVPTVYNGKRLIILGDIHGMSEPLSALLDKVQFNRATDHLIATGDMVHKGPDSAGVITRLTDLNASAVRGNHEDRMLLALAESEASTDADAGLSFSNPYQHKDQTEHLALGRSLSPKHIEWLQQLPVILTVDPLRLVVVHGGLVPGVALDSQEPWAVMNIRSLTYTRKDQPEKERQYAEPEEIQLKKGVKREEKRVTGDQELLVADDILKILEQVDDLQDHYSQDAIAIPTEDRSGEMWATAWNRWQQRQHDDMKLTVVYGHDSKTGFIEGDHTIGLDSGCVRGGSLTALIVEGAAEGFTHRIAKVDCGRPEK